MNSVTHNRRSFYSRKVSKWSKNRIKSEYVITFEGFTNPGLGQPTEDARSDDPRLITYSSLIRFFEHFHTLRDFVRHLIHPKISNNVIKRNEKIHNSV